MRIGFLILALIVAGFASVTPSAFVKAQQSRNQTQPQGGGLSQEKKRELSRMGPEDVFGEVTQEESRSRTGVTGNSRQRSARPTPTPSPSSTRQTPVSATAQPAATQPPAPSAQQTPSAATPSATIATMAVRDAAQSSLSQGSSSGMIDSKWAAPVLILMALAVSIALIYTLSKLIEKIREGSSG